MKTTVEIDLSTSQAQKFVEYVRTLPFATVSEQMKEEGFMTTEEFGDEFVRQAERYFAEKKQHA